MSHNNCNKQSEDCELPLSSTVAEVFFTEQAKKTFKFI
ncbi:hypothetical protein LOT_0882 [Lentilactobacillus otakiensis DSM 19908 = JCM 15040]|uniref:Uncharacterized protein n=1 Tax=Lentilactobacillus otakiensis DSM 19908 = JCM 15040 TaxID=1423780 RepID=S4NC44_9LACO|nr:hypothetical protein LOT_0882 [Lentilactobacillus otakiensis DSM 19908 = JCM 15040]